MFKIVEVYPTLPVVDLQRAKAFYEDKLGLKAVDEDALGGATLQGEAGTKLYIYQRAATKADHTAAALVVKDFDAAMTDLRSKGVTFEEYDMPNLKTVDGVATFEGNGTEYKIAFFKDTEGNILGMSEYGV